MDEFEDKPFNWLKHIEKFRDDLVKEIGMSKYDNLLDYHYIAGQRDGLDTVLKSGKIETDKRNNRTK